MVTTAEVMIRKVMKRWMKKAGEEDVGCSSNACNSRFHAGRIASNASWSRETVYGKRSLTSWEGVGKSLSSVKNLDDSACICTSGMGCMCALERRKRHVAARISPQIHNHSLKCRS